MCATAVLTVQYEVEYCQFSTRGHPYAAVSVSPWGQWRTQPEQINHLNTCDSQRRWCFFTLLCVSWTAQRCFFFFFFCSLLIPLLKPHHWGSRVSIISGLCLHFLFCNQPSLFHTVSLFHRASPEMASSRSAIFTILLREEDRRKLTDKHCQV